MGSEVEAVSAEPQVTVLVNVVVFMCLSWIFQYYKDLFQTLLCALKYAVKAIAVLLKIEEICLFQEM